MRTTTAVFAASLLLVTLTALPSMAHPNLALELLGKGLSHIAPHVFDDTGSLNSPAHELPPSSLLASLYSAEEGVIKGLEPEQEMILARALQGLPLRQRLLKVAVATVEERNLALVKLQAGDAQTGEFRLEDLQEDAVSALRVAFASPLQLAQVDLWSVVPGVGREGPVHQPVFSLSADREEFERALSEPRPARQILGELGLVRFAPLFLRYAGGEPLQKVAKLLPTTAWSVTPVREGWPQLRRSADQDPRLKAATLARVVGHMPVTDNSVALTIDDGPHPLVTTAMLDILRKYGIKATFFVVGEKVEECPELLRRMADEGHELGNHTYDHPRLNHLPEGEALTQIRACGLAVGKVCGQMMRLLRPPGGGIATNVLRAATAANCTVVLWTHNTNDWLKIPAEQIAENGLRDLRPGSIILMHQGSMESARALPLLIAGAQARGLRLTTVGEMLSQAPVPVTPIAEIIAKHQKHATGAVLE